MMELVFDLLATSPMATGQPSQYRFTPAGGVIGRSHQCDWVLADATGTVSGQHARISHERGAYFIQDVSTNGISISGGQAYLPPGQLQLINHGDVFGLAGLSIRARLEPPLEVRLEQVGVPQPAGSLIPDDAFIEPDVLQVLRENAFASPFGEEPGGQHDHHVGFTPVDLEHLIVPRLVAPTQPDEVSAQGPGASPADSFWEAFGQALGVDARALDQAGRESLALNVAGLLKQCVAGLQQCMWTRGELKNELRLAHTVAPGAVRNPLKSSHDAQHALRQLLGPRAPHQPTPEQSVTGAFRDVQAHQVALLSASRAAMRGCLEHFSPRQLTLRFERDGRPPLLATAGSRWRAFGRYHQALQQDDDWTERLLARDFAKAYEEQVRLISTLHQTPQG